MADKSTQLVLDALNRAVADPGGIPLHGSKKTPGLFVSTAAAKLAAQRCKEENFLRVVRTQTRGKTVQEICAITEKGLAFLLSNVSPKQILEELVQTLQARQAQVSELVSSAQHWQGGLESLRGAVEKVLEQLQKPSSGVGPTLSANGSETWIAEVVAHLKQWQASDTSNDCPLPDLYRQAMQTAAHLTIGQFHDGFRKLHDQEQIYLHPWTGPLYEIPEPPYALLIGHEIAYYASIRS